MVRYRRDSDRFYMQSHAAEKLRLEAWDTLKEFIKRLRFAGFNVVIDHDEIAIDVPEDKRELFSAILAQYAEAAAEEG